MSKVILLLEGFGKNLDFLKEVLGKSDWETAVAGDVAAAESMLASGIDLILLDLSNPDTSRLDLSSLGFTDPQQFIESTVEKTHSAAEKYRCGILGIFANEDDASRFKSLGVKFVDQVVQPYYPNDLTLRVRNALGIPQKQKLPEAVKMKTDRLKLDLLKNLLDNGVATVHPAPDYNSPTGYNYPELKEYSDLDVNEVSEILEDLTERACLERKLYDKVHICPTCNRYNINFREVDPQSRSVNIELQEMIHHFACGYVGPIGQFQQGLKLACPKCRAELRHIGLDYEKPAETFICNENGHVFTDPAVEAFCLACGDKFDPKDLIVRNIYSYTLTGRAEDAVQMGQLEPAEIDPVLLDSQMGVYHYAFFERQLNTEVSRSQRHKHRFSIVLMGLDYYEEYINKLGRSEALAYLRVLAQVVRELRRVSDVPARFEKDKIVVLLSETPAEGAAGFIKRIRERLKEVKVPRTDVKLSFSAGVISYPELGETAEELLEGAKNAYNRAQNSGKDTIAEKPR